MKERTPLQQAVSKLLGNLAAHPAGNISCDSDFLTAIGSIRAQIDNVSDGASIPALIEAAATAVNAHAGAFGKFLQARRTELAAIQAQLTPPVQPRTSTGDRAVTAPAELCSNPPVLVERPAPPASEIDQLTGLPTIERARQSILSAMASRRSTYVAVFVVERLEIINSRFGFRVGDRMLLQFSQHIGQQLAQGDQLFRWRGPTFVALLERDQAQKMVDAEVMRISASRIEYTVNTKDRDVLLRVNSSHNLFRVAPDADIDAIIERIDSFAADRSSPPT